jgi:hypothetical protein
MFFAKMAEKKVVPFNEFYYQLIKLMHVTPCISPISTNKIYEIGQNGPITLVLKKLPRKFSLVKIHYLLTNCYNNLL